MDSNSALVAPVRACFQNVQLFAWLEAHSLARRDADFSASSGVAADAGLARTDAEDAKAAEFDAVARRESLFQSLKNGIHGRFSFGSWQACPFDHVMDNILLDQCRRPLIEEIYASI